MFVSRKRLAGAVGLAVVASGLLLPSAPAQAASTGLVITEFYGNGGNSGANLNADFIELFNPTGSAISLNGMSVQYRSSGGTAAANGAAPLSGSVPPGKHFLVQLSGAGANGVALPTPDLVATGVNAGGTNGLVFLAIGVTPLSPPTGSVVNNPAIVDLVGFGTSNTYETAATAAGSATTSFRRTTENADGDNNSTDFTVGGQTPVNSNDNAAAALDAGTVANKVGTVGTAISGFSLVATGGTSPYHWTAPDLPPGVTVADDGAVSGTPTAANTYSVIATVTDSAVPTPASDTVAFTFTVRATPVQKTIAEVQGPGSASPLVDTNVTVQGVVTAMYPDPYPVALTTNGGFDGMYIQTPGADTTDGASDAVFVFGADSMPAGVEIGDSVEVTGPVSEYGGLTEITPDAGGVVEIATLGTAQARTIAYPTDTAGREAHEGELLAPTDTFTVTNSYATNQYGEVGLATGDHPLVQPTEVYRDDDTTHLNEVKADNAARAVTLDDGTSINYLTNNSPQQDLPLPWLTATHAVRVGAEATFLKPVVLDYRNNTWKFQPTAPVKDAGTDLVTFEDTRAQNLTPQPVGGDLKLATFNVLNFFNTTGAQYIANGAAQSTPVNTQCTYYNDRDGNPIGNNTCGVVTNGTNAGNGPRGAATQVSLDRQRDKIVNAINTLGADIVSLEEIENSMKLVGETNRDDALAYLVDALNAGSAPGTWKFVHSPAEALVSTAVSEQDVIRPAFIYKPAKVTPVGVSDILFGTTEFANAREPLAQAFKPQGALDSEAFAVIVNHFKSKGDSNPAATGDNANSPDYGAFNGDRTRQATRLAQFANEFASSRGIDAVFLTGDFNAYTEEDPMHALYDAGYTPIESAGEESYSYGGLSGSLDHVLGNAAAMVMVTGADVWDINAAESVGYQYGRFNYNVTQLFDASNPFAASDHNPEIVGIDVPAYGTDYTPVQILATNDFHGRLLADGANAAGAAVLSGAVKELRSDTPNTVFAAAGDLIGASTFESFIQDDVPTIDALNEAGLEVSAAGNHEFDAGYEDLVGRVQTRAHWEYIAANVEEPVGRDDLAETWTKTFGAGADAIEVGFIGAVTEDLPSLVSPAGIQGVTVTDIVDATNAAAATLKTGGADLVVVLVHEGAPSTSCGAMTDPATAWGNIVTGVSANVDAIVSGHTHLAYNCSFPVQSWVTAGRAVTERPVVSAGQYGTFLNQLVFTFDDGTGQLVAKSQDVIGLVGTGYPADQAVKTIVDDAVAQATTLGAQVLGQIGGGFNRAKLANGTTENRGGESTLGNLVAEVQRWATETPEAGSAQIAFMNPGGLRADMTGTGAGAFPRDLTYKQAAVVQPFANTLVNMDLTGANIKLALEQQWQRDGSGNVPSRPFLRLGLSKGFTYTYDPALPEGSRVTGMWLDGAPISPTATYSVTVNSFLASGGDNFRAFNNGTDKRDTGKVDLQAMVDYLDAFASTTPLALDTTQRSVGVSFPGTAPASYLPGEHVRFDLSSLAFSAPGDLKDTQVRVSLGAQELGTFTVDNTVTDAVTDEAGKAVVDVVVPAGMPAGARTLTVTGLQTGTTVPVTVQIGSATPPPPAAVNTTTSATAGAMVYGTNGAVQVTVTPATASGAVTITENGVAVGSGSVTNGAGTVSIDGTVLDPGSHTLTVRYAGNATHNASQGTVTVQVAKAATSLTASAPAVDFGDAATVTVSATPGTAAGAVTVSEGGATLGTGTLTKGSGSVTIGGSLEPGSHSLTVRYAGDTRHNEATTTATLVVRKVASTATVVATPSQVVVESGTAVLRVSLTSGRVTATGTVTALVDGEEVGSGSVSDGQATVRVGPFDRVGVTSVEVRYSGDDHVAGSTATTSVQVVKATPVVTADHNPTTVKAGKTRARLVVKVKADGFTPGGFVTVTLPNGDTLRARLDDGRVTLTLPKFASPGTKVLTVAYEGDAKTKAATVEHEVKVVRKK